MMMDAVFGGAVSERGDVSVVAIREDAQTRVCQEFGQDVDGPKDVAVLACPGIFWVAVQAMNEDDTISISCLST
jgi:hypothetical protein